MHRKPSPKDAQRIPDVGEHLPPDHPLRRKDDARPDNTLYTSKRLMLPNDRPVEFTRPMGVIEARERYAHERKSRRQSVVDGGYLKLGLMLAALVVLVIASVVILFNWWWPL